MATDPSQIIMGLLQTAGLGSTPNSVAQQNIQLRNGQQQNQLGALQIAGAQAAQQREQQYTADLNAYYAHPTTAALSQLAARYPDHAEALKQSYTIMDADKRSSDQTAFGSLFGAAQSGRVDLAVKLLQQRQAAERQAGHDTTELDDLLTSLGSSDPAAKAQALKQLQGFSQIHLAAADPTKFADVFGALGKGGEQFTLGQGQTRYDAQGNPIASVAPKPDYLVVPEGGTAFPLNGSPALTGGGGQTSGVTGAGPSAPVPRTAAARVAQLADVWSGIAPGTQPTSGFRTPQEQAALVRRGVTSATNSAHSSGNAIDVPIVPGQTADSVRAAYAQQGVNVRVIQESGRGPNQGTGPHFHIQRLPGSATPATQAAPQQGARVGPDGIIYGKPKQREAPSGYRWNGDNLVAIPGGPADKAGEAGASTLTGDAYLKSLPTGRSALIRAIIDGRAPAPRPGTRFGEQLIEDVAHADPTIDTTTLPLRQQTRQAFAGAGKNAQVMGSYNRFAAHLNSLWENHLELGGANLGPFSGIAATIGQSWDPKHARAYTTELEAVQGEFQKLTKLGVANEGEANRLIAALAPNQSAEGRAAAIQSLAKLVLGGYQPLRDQWASVFPNQPMPVDLTRNSRAVLSNVLSGGKHALPTNRDGTPIAPPPAAAVQMLRGNPKLRSAFDAKYGAGASARALGR